MKKKKQEEQEHVITEREKRGWKASKARKPIHKRPVLSRKERIEFLELVAQLSGRSTFERKLGLSPSDVEFYKKELNVESQDEARRLARQFKAQSVEQSEVNIQKETKKAREAEQVANKRLDTLQANKERKAADKKSTVNVDSVRKEDADRQRRFAEQQAGLAKPDKEWRLPMEENGGSEAEQIDRFRREIIYHGFSFLRAKYNGVSSSQVKWEAARLGMQIQWDIVR